MSRAAIVATTVAASILAFSSPCVAASDEETVKSGDLMSAAFRCLTYARMFQDYKEEERLLLIGLKAGRVFYEGMKSLPDMECYVAFMRKTSTDFMVGLTYNDDTTKARDEIVKADKEHWLDAPTAKTQAELAYRKSNCSLIQ